MIRDRQIEVAKPRYSVREVQAGFEIVDSTGRNEAYLIERINSDGVDISDFKKSVAEGWCYTWNLVEMGYCGACGYKFAEGEHRYPALGFHRLDRIICFQCVCSQEE